MLQFGLNAMNNYKLVWSAHLLHKDATVENDQVASFAGSINFDDPVYISKVGELVNAELFKCLAEYFANLRSTKDVTQNNEKGVDNV